MTRYSVPVRYTENFLASEDNTHETYKNLYYDVTVRDKGQDIEAWFKVPEFC